MSNLLHSQSANKWTIFLQNRFNPGHPEELERYELRTKEGLDLFMKLDVSAKNSLVVVVFSTKRY